MHDEYKDAPVVIQARQVTSFWDEKSVCWDNKPSMSGDIYSLKTVDGVGAYTFPINPVWVKGWMYGYNHGVYLTCKADQIYNLKKFCSKEYGDSAKSPKLIVTYEGGTGLESYWPYKSFDLGVAGEASVNIFTGNLVLQDVDFAVPAKGFDLKLIRTYNSLSNDTNNIAPGWMIDGFSHVEPSGFMSLFGDSFYLTVLLVDGDGSKHIFKFQSMSKYIAPDGVDLEVIYKNSEKAFYIKDRNQVKRVYSSETGHLLRKEDRYGNKIIYTYANDKLTAITDSSTPPRSIHLGYNSAGKLATITGPMGRVARYGYDSQGHLERYTDFYGKVTKYEYDTKHRLEAVVDPKGNRTIFSYLNAYESSKDENRIHFVITADQAKYGVTATQKWRFSPPQITNTDFTVNVLGPMNYSNKYVMNPDGTLQNKVIIDSENNKDIRYNYDYKNRRVELIGNGKSITKYVYETTNPDGIPDLKEVIRDYSTQPDHFNYKTTYQYDSYHNLTSVTDAKRTTTTYQWSSDGKKLESVTDAELNKTSFSYLTDGLMKTMTISPSKSEFVTTTFTYDGYGYLETVTQPFNETETAIAIYDYDLLGRLKYAIDPEHNETVYHYDDAKNGLLKKMTNSKYAVTSSNWVEYLYDDNYNLTNITYTNQLGRYTTSYQYNSLEQIKKIDYPDGTYEVYDYDDFGRLERITYSNGDVESYIYYPTSQLQFINYSDGSWVEFTYDEFGNRKTMEKINQPKITYDYDNLNRLKKESNPNELPIEYRYDGMDNLMYLTVNGRITLYEYNKVNKLKKVTYSNASTIYTYDGVYNITKVTYPDGSGESFKYNKANLITRMDYPNSSIDASYSYSYYLNGNLEKLQKEISTKPDYYIHYFYDPYGQLESAIQKKYIEVQGSADPDIPGKGDPIIDPPPVDITSIEPIGDFEDYLTHYETILQRREDFEYDPLGNMTLWEDNDVQKIFTYDANNKLTQMERRYRNHSIITPLTYDKRGNILTKGDTSYQFNAQGKLQKIIKDANVYSFDYDGNGRRIKQTVNGNETKYILDKNWNTVVEVSNGSSKRYINGVKTIGSYKDQQVSYNYHDYLGSTIGVKTDTSLSQYMYSPFGRDEVVVDDFSYFDSPSDENWRIYDGTGTIETEKIVSYEENYVLRAASSEGTGFGIRYPESGSLFVKRTGLSVKYRSNESMIFYVRVLGKDKSQYYLSYYIGWDSISSPLVNEYYKIPLGSETKDGNWRLLERDLNADLKEGFNTEVDSVLWFCIRGGDYRLDDLRLKGQDVSGNTRKFTDEDEDGSGLYYLRNRYYDPELGRFISQDSYKGSIYDPLSLNQYIYVKNNRVPRIMHS